MTPIHYTQVTVIPSAHLDPLGVFTDTVPVFTGTVFSNQYPVAAFNAGIALGRVAEINITGSGGLGTVVGKRLNINIDKGVNARSTFPSVGVYQPVSNIEFGAGFSTTIISGTVTVSTTAATPNIGMSNGGVGVGIIVSPGASSSFVLRSILAGSGINVAQVGDNVQISTVAGAGLQGTNGNGLTVTPTTVALGLASISSAGAAPQLSGIQTDYWAGDGVFRALPTFSGVTSFNGATGAVQWVNGTNTTVVSLGGGQFRLDVAGGSGAVTSVTSGNPTALTVSPTTGAVVVTPNGQSTTLNSAWNPTTRLLSIPVGVYQSGILTSSFLNQFDLSVAASANTVETRFNDVTVNPATAILNFKGPGVTSVTNGIGVEITIAGGGGSGITGVSVNGVGNYANIIVDGAGVSVVGNHITVTGGGGGGVLGGTSGNGLIVNPNSVSLNLATITSAGAMPVLPNNAALFLNGVGAWVTPPSVSAGVSSFNLVTGAINLVNGANTTVVNLGGGSFKIDVPTMGGGGGISSVTTNSTQLSGFVSGGGTVLNLNLGGMTQSDSNSWNPATRLLTVTEYLTEQGNVWGIVQRGFTIDTGLPTALPNFTLYGTPAGTWNQTANILVQNDQFTALRSDSSSNRAAILLDGLAKRAFMSVGTNAAIIDMYANSIRLKSAQQGFFDAMPISKPNVITGDHASTQAALQALGLINLI